MIVIILLFISIVVFLSVIQPQPSEHKSRQQADSGYFGYSDNGSHHDGCSSDGVLAIPDVEAEAIERLLFLFH